MEKALLALFPAEGLEYSFPEISELLDCRSREDKIELSLALQKLLKKKVLEENHEGKFALPGKEKAALMGKVDFVNPRMAYVRLEGEGNGKDLQVQAEDLRGAQDGDLVEVELFAARRGKQEGVVTKVLQRARDEAHRFGISFHRNKRSKAGLKMALESVPGLGAKTVETIYRKFPSLSEIREEHRSEIEKEIGKKRSDVLFEFLKSAGGEPG
jgi:exoribonuclease R